MTQTIGETHHDHWVRRTGRVLPLSFLLLVFFTCDLDQPRAATSPFRRGTRSDASCTVQEFPILRQEPELRCQKQLSVFIKKDLRVMAQNTSHEPRNSVCKVLSQDPSEMRAVCRTLPLCASGHRLVAKI